MKIKKAIYTLNGVANAAQLQFDEALELQFGNGTNAFDKPQAEWNDTTWEAYRQKVCCDEALHAASRKMMTL